MTNVRAHLQTPRPHWLIELVVHGELQVRMPGGDWIDLSPGHGALYAPHTPWEERVAGGGPCQSVWVFFDPADPGVAEGLAGEYPVRRLQDPQGLARHCVEALQAPPGDDRAARLRRCGQLCELVGLLLTAAEHDGEWIVTERPASGPSFVERADRFMRTRLRSRCRVADVAAHVGMSASGLAHAYRRVTGHTPMAALRAMRVEAARAMLMRGASTLDAIAAETGFADGFHLSRTFKRHLGVSPREYLRGAA